MSASKEKAASMAELTQEPDRSVPWCIVKILADICRRLHEKCFDFTAACLTLIWTAVCNEL